MKVSEAIPTTPQARNDNPEGYVKHQLLLKQLAQWCESNGVAIRLPEDRNGPDGGIDLYVNGRKLDLKSFGVQAHGSSYTWDSPFYKGKNAPVYSFTETDFFVHPTDGDPSTWIVCRTGDLRTSKFDLPPYFFQSDSVTMAQLVR